MSDTTAVPTVTAKPDAPVSNSKTGLTDSIRAHFAGDGPLLDKARSFAKERPWASAALAGVVGIALLNTLRGKR